MTGISYSAVPYYLKRFQTTCAAGTGQVQGCDGFIQKPFKVKELSQKLREILDEK